MAVKLRLMRIGRRHRPFFRLNAVDLRTPRNGRVLEKLGHYDPIHKDKEKQIVLNLERIKYWLEKGAVPSDTVSDILLKQGIKTKQGEQRKARRQRAKAAARKKGVPFTKAEKIAAQKQAEADAKKAEEEAKAKTEAAKEAEKKQQEQAKAQKETEKSQESAPEQPESDESKKQ